jgi:hypothetical protein
MCVCSRLQTLIRLDRRHEDRFVLVGMDDCRSAAVHDLMLRELDACAEISMAFRAGVRRFSLIASKTESHSDTNQSRNDTL